jgi:hypothetical protein
LGVKKKVVVNTMRQSKLMRNGLFLFSPRIHNRKSNYTADLAHICVDKWAHRVRNSRVDSNSCVIRSFKHPISGEELEHTHRIWEISTVNGRFEVFLKSNENREFKSQTATDMGRHQLLQSVYQCIRNPRQKSYVDPIRSGYEYLMIALKKFLVKNENIHEQLKAAHQGFDAFKIMLNRGKASAFTKYCLFSKQLRPDLKNSESGETPKMFSFDCAFGKCSLCGVKQKANIVSHLIIASCVKLVKVMVWKDADCSGNKKQRDLTPESMTIKEFVSTMTNNAAALVSHVARIQWTRHTIELDISRLAPNKILVFTDFAATLDLSTIATLN